MQPDNDHGRPDPNNGGTAINYITCTDDYIAGIIDDYTPYANSGIDYTHVVFAVDELARYERALIDTGIERAHSDGVVTFSDIVAAARRAAALPDQPERTSR